MSKLYADRVYQIESSTIRKVFREGSVIKDVVNLGIGIPHFQPSKILQDELYQATLKGHNIYTFDEGIEELRELISKRISERKGRKPGEVVITNGATGGIFLLLNTLVNANDEVIILDPGFNIVYEQDIKLLGAKPIFWNNYPDFSFKKETLLPLISSKTKGIMLNSPANPTGKVMSQAEIDDIIEIAKEHDLFIISDEVYEDYYFSKEPLPSSWKNYEKTFLVNSFSKSHGITGWRIGYIAFPKEYFKPITTLQSISLASINSMSQYALLKAFDKEVKQEIDNYVKEYKEKRDFFYNEIKNSYEISKCEGGFYFFLKAPNNNASIFFEKAIKEKLIFVPGKAFSNYDTHFRTSFGVSDQDLEKGCKILKKLV